MMRESHFVLPLASPHRRSLQGSGVQGRQPCTDAGYNRGPASRIRGQPKAMHWQAILEPEGVRWVGVLSTPAAHVVLSFELPERLQCGSGHARVRDAAMPMSAGLAIVGPPHPTQPFSSTATRQLSFSSIPALIRDLTKFVGPKSVTIAVELLDRPRASR